MNVPYDDEDVTTYEVAKKLEKKYQVMGIFVEKEMNNIQQVVVDAVLGEIDNMKMGKPKTTLGNRTLGGIEELFRDFLDADEWQNITGKTIMAARMGITSRKKMTIERLLVNGFMGGDEPRPAFIDTGLYQATFRAWIDVNGK